MATIPRAPHAVPYRSPSRHANLDSQGQVWQNILIYFLPPIPTTFRGVLLTRIPKAGRLTEGESRDNLLLNVLKPANQTPTVPIEWPNPVRKKLPTDLWSYSQYYQFNIPAPVTFVGPFNNTNELPRRPVYAQQPQVTRPPLSTGIDTFFGAPGQTQTSAA